MSVYRICLNSYGGPRGYCTTEYLYTNWYCNVEEAICEGLKLEKTMFDRRRTYFLERMTKNNKLEEIKKCLLKLEPNTSPKY